MQRCMEHLEPAKLTIKIIKDCWFNTDYTLSPDNELCCKMGSCYYVYDTHFHPTVGEDLYSCALNSVIHHLTIGSCFSVHYRVMEHVRSLENTKEAVELCIKSDAKNGQQYQKWLFAVSEILSKVKRIVTALMPSLLFRCFSLFLPHLRTLAQGKRSENCFRFGTDWVCCIHHCREIYYFSQRSR